MIQLLQLTLDMTANPGQATAANAYNMHDIFTENVAVYIFQVSSKKIKRNSKVGLAQ